jgi:hypothetical protein
MKMQTTFTKACAIAGYPAKNLIDDRVMIRRETGGLDIVTTPTVGRPALDIDDVATLIRYAEMRSDGYPVKLAGTIAARLRTAMRDYPDADQLTLVTCENGNRFARPADELDLSTGYNSGAPVREALTVDVRNLRERVERAIEAYEPGSEVEDAAA